jgi:CNT family concentrative nucleoside transporter
MLRATSLLGLAVFIFLAWLMSTHKRRVNIRVVVGGLALQFLFAVVILWTPPGQWLFAGITILFEHLQDFVAAGTQFMFGMAGEIQTESRTVQLTTSFAFGVLPTIIFFSSLMSVLYYFGVVQFVVRVLAGIMQRTLGISGAESLSAAANVFVGHTEAPLVIRPYLSGMTTSELNAVMVGGFATISGGLLAAYSGMGIDAGHLVTASVISAPAALLIAKIMQPEIDDPQTMGRVSFDVPRPGVNPIEAAAIGATDGMKLALNIAAMLLAFLALIALLDAGLAAFGSLLGFKDAEGLPTWSLASALGYAFCPLAWLMGVEGKDCLRAGELLGLKTVANEFLAYERLGQWLQEGSDVELSRRSTRILTYALAGFSNVSAIGIQIGGIGGLAPERRPDLARLGMRAMIGGLFACCMTACVVGVLI